MNKGGRAHRWVRIAVAFSMTFIGIVIAPLTPTPTALAVDTIDEISVYGIWDDIFAEDNAPQAPPCLVEVPDPQQENPTTLNTVRFGYPANADDCGSPSDRSGFGFQGRVITQAITSDDVFALGTFTHFNNPISADDDNVGTGTLTATIVFDNPLGPGTLDVEVVWDVELDETPNDPDDNPGDVCPHGQSNSLGCDDQVTFDQNIVTESVDVGETTLTFDIAGFGTVGEPCVNVFNGALPSPGSAVTTPEGGERTACMYGQVKPGTLIIEKNVIGGDASDDVDFTVQELSQKSGNAEIGSEIPVNVPGNGSTSVDLEAGVYSITEALPADQSFANLSCSTDGNNAFSILDGDQTDPEAIIDLDSGETITCIYTNDKLGTINIEKTGDGNQTDFEFTHTDFGGGDTTTTLGLNSASTPVQVLPGEYTIEEAEVAADWSLTEVFCFAGGDDTNPIATGSIATRAVTVDVAAGQAVTCRFENIQDSKVELRKVGEPDSDTTTPFDFDTTVDGDLNGESDLQASINGATVTVWSGNGGKSVTIEELTPQGWDLEDVACSRTAGSNSQPSTWDDSGDSAVVNVAAGETVLCEFTNIEQGRIIVEKVTTNGDGTFGFDLPGTAGDGSITTTNGVGTSTLAVNVVPGSNYSITETIPPGWNLDAATCSNQSGSLTNGETAGTINGIDVAAGEVVTCTFTNSRETAQLTLTKDWSGDALAGNSVTLTATGNDTQPNRVANGDSTAPSTDNDAVLTIYPGEKVDLKEEFGVGNEANYSTFLSCNNAAAGSLTYNPGDLAGSFDVVADDPQNVTCTFTNSRTSAMLTLRKVWVNGFEGDLDRQLGPDTSTIIADDQESLSTAGEGSPTDVTIPILSGETVSLSETFGAGNTGSYTTGLTCSDDEGGLTYTAGDLSGTYTMPAVAADVTCTFTNTRTSTDLTLTKVWTNAAESDSVDLSIVGEAGTGQGTNSGDGVVTDDATLTVYSGEVVDLSEAFSPGDADWYNTGLTCTAGDLTYTADALTAELEVTTTATDPIICTFTNDRRTANVVVAKDVAPDTDGGVFDLSINGEVELLDAGDGEATGAVSVFVGDPVTVSEADGTDTDLANYTSVLACDNGVVPDPNSGVVGGFDVPDTLEDGATITCTFTNTRRSATLTLTKDWEDAAATDEVSLKASGSSDNSLAALGWSSAPDTDSNAVLTIYAGELVTLEEAYVPDNTGSYTAALSCTDESGFTYSAGDLTGTYAVPTTPIDVTCTFVNTRTEASLTLTKVWVDGYEGDGDTDADTSTITAGDLSSISAAGEATPASVTIPVASGETVVLSEVFGDNVGSYDADLSCTAAGLTYTEGDLSGSYAMPAVAANVTCTFTNTRTRVDLVVDKAWVDAVADDTTDITVTGDVDSQSGTSTATGAADTETDAAVVTATVLSGETVEIDEVLGAGNTALYTSTLDCGAGVIGTTDGEITVAKDATDDINCTFENTAQRGTIIINKNIDGVADGEFGFSGNWTDGETATTAFSIETGDPIPRTGSVTFNNVLVPKDGLPYTVVETGTGTSYDATSVTCVDTYGGSGPADGTDLPLTGSIDLDNDEVVTCTFTNTEKAKIIVIKDADPDSAAEFDFESSFGDDFTLVDDGSDSANEEESTLLDARDGKTYTVTELATPGWSLDTATCSGADSFDLNGSALDVDVMPGVTATCTFVNTANPAGLTATKQVDGVIGEWGPFEFTLTDGGSDDTFTGEPTQAVDNLIATPAVDTQAQWGDLVEGQTYTLSENEVAGYETGAEFTCSALLPGTPIALEMIDQSADPGFQFVAAAGATYSCAITNTAIPPTIVVEKTTVGGAGTFTFDVTPTDGGDAVDPIEVTTVAADTPVSSSPVDLQAGIGYSVAERLSDEWVEGALTCSVTDASDVTTDYVADTITKPGDEISCEITNTRRAQIVVEKTTVPAEAAGTFGFEATWDGEAADPADFELGDGDSQQSGFVDPDVAYTVTELASPGFDLTGVTCSSDIVGVDNAVESIANRNAVVTPQPGETVTCTFTNSQAGQVTIEKDANPNSISRTGNTYTVSYDLIVRSTSYVAESFDLTDTPAFAGNVTISSVLVNGPGIAGPGLELGPTGGTIVDDGSIAARAGVDDPTTALVYTVEITFKMTPSTVGQECNGTTPGVGTFNSATVTFRGGSPSDSDCVDLPEPEITVDKTPDSGATATQVGDGFQYQAVYTVTVENIGEGPGSYTVADVPALPTGVNVVSKTFDPVPDPTSNVIQPDGEDVYTVTVLFTVPADLPLADRTCGQQPTPGTGGYNTATVTYGGGTPSDWGCIDIPNPDIEVEKTPDGGVEATQVGDGFQYQAVYTVTVDNNGDGPGAYTVADLPEFPTGATVDSVVLSPEPNEVSNPIAAGGQDVYTVTVLFTVPGDLPIADRECAEVPTAGQGGYNGVTVTFDGGTDDDGACVDIPDPNVEYDKVVVGDGAVYNGDNDWTVTYRIDVTNLDPAEGEAGPAVYDLTDTFDFGPGVTVTGVQVVPAPVSDPFTGVAPDNVLADDRPIAGGASESWTVVVDVTIVPTAGTVGDCDVDGGGLRNAAGLSVSTDDGARPDQEACADFATLTLVKVLSDDVDGGNATVDDFVLTATNGDTVVTGTTPVRESAPAGTYQLEETQIPGYTSPGFVCGDADPSDSVTIELGDDVVCVITNDDEPVDLELDKDDAGVVAVAGGDPFEYTISVRNIGARPADLDEDVTVTDELPEPLEWTTFPDNCSAVGQTLTCDIDPALLPAGSDWVVISTTVSAPADTEAGTYTNEAFVTTEDDPVCQPVGDCLPPPCEQADGNNNVDCEDTPVEREAELDIVKEDDVTGSVVNGETYSYDLSISNLGPSTVYNVVVTDDLPDGISLVELAYDDDDWSCNDADPIECDYLQPLPEGPAASSITVTVQVGASAIFADDTIVNTAVVNGTLDEEGDDPVDPDDSTEETPLERTIEIEVLTVDCLQDAPFVFYDITALGFVPDGPVTFRLYDANDDLVATLERDELSGRFVYPGAAVDSEGNGTDWPGWKFENGTWELDDTDAILREGLRITVEINPTGEVEVEYPPANSACADPTQTSADLSIEKNASATQLAIPVDGSAIEFDWILDVTNDGPDPGVNVVVSDVIPDDLTITDVTSSDFSCSTSGQTVTCTRPQLAVGGTGTITISVETDLPNNYENVGTVDNDVPDPDLTNNFDDESVEIVASQPPVTQAPPPVTLPPTGSDSTSPVLRTALMLLAIGALGLLVARRRRTGDTPMI